MLPLFLREKLRGLFRPRRHQITVVREKSPSDVLRTVEIREGAMLLDALLKQGVDYPHLCKLGDCRRCRSRLVNTAQEPALTRAGHYEGALSDAEIEAGYFLACRSTPLADLTIHPAPSSR